MALALEQEVDIHKLAEVALLVEMVGMVEVHTHSLVEQGPVAVKAMDNHS